MISSDLWLLYCLVRIFKFLCALYLLSFWKVIILLLLENSFTPIVLKRARFYCLEMLLDLFLLFTFQHRLFLKFQNPLQALLTPKFIKILFFKKYSLLKTNVAYEITS